MAEKWQILVSGSFLGERCAEGYSPYINTLGFYSPESNEALARTV